MSWWLRGLGGTGDSRAVAGMTSRGAALRVKGSIIGVFLVAFLAVSAGCVAVQGRRTGRTEAATGSRSAPITLSGALQVLQTYDAVTRQADLAHDPRGLAQVETGAALAAHQARLALTPAGRVVPHIEFHAHVAIPRVRGHPKWFVAGALRPGDGPGWVAVFEQPDAGARWRAVFVTYHDEAMPPLAAHGGHAVAVDADAGHLRAAPGKVADRHAAAVVRGARATAALFADNRVTSGLTRILAADRSFFSRHGWEGAEHAADADGRVFALRTEGGDAVVWYSLRLSDEFTNRAQRYRVGLTPDPARLLGQRWVAQQVRLEWRYSIVALVPKRTERNSKTARVRILGSGVTLVRTSGR